MAYIAAINALLITYQMAFSGCCNCNGSYIMFNLGTPGPEVLSDMMSLTFNCNQSFLVLPDYSLTCKCHLQVLILSTRNLFMLQAVTTI